MCIKLIQVLLFTSVITACSTIPKVLQGNYSKLTPYQAKQKHITMEKVRWSGQIVEVINDKDKTCFVIVSSETDKNLRPNRIIPKKGGRYIACKPEFLEPEAFADKLVTITGTLSQYTTEKVGGYNYEYPVVSTDKIYIWSLRRPAYHGYTPIFILNRNHIFCHYKDNGFCL